MIFHKVVIIGALAGAIVEAQQPQRSESATFQSRVQEIEHARDSKTAFLTPEKPTRLEQFLIHFKDDKMLERFTEGMAGVRVIVGGMPTGSGFALNPKYERKDIAGGRFSIDALAGFSSRGW